jgi:hypothetical protein
MTKDLLRKAAAHLGVGTERIFGLAQEWAEKPMPRKWTRDQYILWKDFGNINHHLEEIIDDFILDVLAERVHPNEIPK